MVTPKFVIRRALQYLAVASAFIGVSVTTSAGCGDSGGAGGNDCVGGVIVDGKCEGKCEPNLCLAGNTCYENRCVLVCTSVEDCIVGQQECEAVKDDAGDSISACIYTTKSQMAGVACPLGTECAGASACADGSPCGTGVTDPKCTGAACRPLTCISAGVGDADAYCSTFDCTTDTDCVPGMRCSETRVPEPACAGTCGNGKVEGGEDCDGSDLDKATCAALMLGAGTLKCNSDCTFDTSGCAKHITDPACVPPADFTANGATYQEGPISLLRNVCLKRAQCDTCTTDFDCSAIAGQACISIGGENRCAAACAGAGDCNLDSNCTSGHCVPKFGKCVGTGKFCDPCVNDLDCKEGGATSTCLTLLGDDRACIDYETGSDGSLVPSPTCTGVCVNCGVLCLSGTTKCTSDSNCVGGDCDVVNGVCANCGACTNGCQEPCTEGDPCTGVCGQAGGDANNPPFCEGLDSSCPVAPGGLHGTCLDETLEVTPGSAEYLHCTFPMNASSMKSSCY